MNFMHRVFVFAFAGLMIFPASLRAESLFIGQLIDPVLLRGVEDVFLDGDRAYLPCREGHRLTICSIKDPAHPEILGTFTHPELDQAAGFALDGSTAYLASHGNHQLFVLDVSDAAHISLRGKVLIGAENGPRGLYKIAYRDGYCYVALQQAKRMFVVDVRDPSRPEVVSEIQVTTDDDGPFSVLLHGHYALVGTLFGHHNRLAVVDIQDPLHPQLIDALLDPDLCQVSGKVIGDRYIASCWNGNSLLVMNLSQVTRPYVEGKLVDTRLGKPNRCEIVKNRAYLPMVEGNGIAVVDISDPARPRFVNSVTDPVVMKKTYGIAARGNLLFVGSREGNSLVILDRDALDHPSQK